MQTGIKKKYFSDCCQWYFFFKFSKKELIVLILRFALRIFLANANKLQLSEILLTFTKGLFKGKLYYFGSKFNTRGFLHDFSSKITGAYKYQKPLPYP